MPEPLPLAAIRPRAHPAWLALPLLVLAGLLFLRQVDAQAASLSWWSLLTSTAPTDLNVLLVQHALAPRFVMSLLCGLALGLSGVLFQQILRNPLAEPGTLGVFAGGKLAVVLGSLGVAGLPLLGQTMLATLGGAATLAVVLAMGWRGGLSPVRVILAGLVVTLFLDATARTLMLFHHAALTDLFVWQGGALGQNNWTEARTLALSLAALALACVPLATPLSLLDLEEEGARGLGLSMTATRLGGLSVAVLLAAVVVGAVGMIGFIGLAGPVLARLAGARRFRDRLVWGPVVAAGLLALTDQGVSLAEGASALPTGAVTALLGGPLLLWLVRARLGAGGPGVAPTTDPGPRPLRRSWLWVLASLPLLALAAWAALAFGRLPGGWDWASGADLSALAPWRGPRVAVALAAGAMLALAGVILQRLTGNTLASPELLGISSGAALVLIVLGLATPALSRPVMILAATGGAFLALTALLGLTRRSGHAPEHLLLAGVALATVQGACLTLLLFSGDPRTVRLLGWLSGSTYGVTAGDATITGAVALGLAALVPLTGRWLAILPLGEAPSRALGLALGRTRLSLLLLAALLTATATLAVGPLGFIGLMAPHLARLSGFRRPLPHLAGAAILGAGLMLAADWLGRMVAYPWQIPAGLMATLLGAIYFLTLLGRRAQ